MIYQYHCLIYTPFNQYREIDHPYADESQNIEDMARFHLSKKLRIKRHKYLFIQHKTNSC